MANKILKLTIILSILISLSLFVSSNDDDKSHHDIVEDEDEDEEAQDFYIVDTPLQHHGSSRSRFLASIIKKGRRCNLESSNICNGVRANKGKDLLFCCKKHCRNVLSDKNNCNVCGHKCKEGERCCNGVCTNVLTNVHHCGKCKNECSSGAPCGNGFCGYA
ncbi:protein GRIM REAPER [Lathyrus oleraceus]|uniref:protein GRIM REAPER n=1 Tax=Pisum sativum TaxID=3888 RepID=UPI0021D38D56|nr:protein GRIM REAPER [Pisum sativum]